METTERKKITNRKEAIGLVYKKGHGRIEELKEQLSQDLFEEFCVLGVIQRGATLDENDKAVGTWKTTGYAKVEYEFYYGRERSQKELKRTEYLSKLILP
jgi:hypothetical protein